MSRQALARDIPPNTSRRAADGSLPRQCRLRGCQCRSVPSHSWDNAAERRLDLLWSRSPSPMPSEYDLIETPSVAMD